MWRPGLGPTDAMLARPALHSEKGSGTRLLSRESQQVWQFPSLSSMSRSHGLSFLLGLEGKTRNGHKKKITPWSPDKTTQISTLCRNFSEVSFHCYLGTIYPKVAMLGDTEGLCPAWTSSHLGSSLLLPASKTPQTLKDPAKSSHLPLSFLWSELQNSRTRREIRRHSIHLFHFANHKSWYALLCTIALQRITCGTLKIPTRSILVLSPFY